jgi:GntR family transcriptional regulator
MKEQYNHRGKQAEMEIQISSVNQTPIYEQIENQIKDMIRMGVYKSGEQLPSIRILARDLKVGIITCRRAYDDLCAQGILISHPGKGVFVADIQVKQMQEINRDAVWKQLGEICQTAKKAGIKRTELIEYVNQMFD